MLIATKWSGLGIATCQNDQHPLHFVSTQPMCPQSFSTGSERKKTKGTSCIWFSLCYWLMSSRYHWTAVNPNHRATRNSAKIVQIFFQESLQGGCKQRAKCPAPLCLAAGARTAGGASIPNNYCTKCHGSTKKMGRSRPVYPACHCTSESLRTLLTPLTPSTSPFT